MSRAPPPGGAGRMPYGGAPGLPGSNPRAAMGQSRQPPGGDPYGQGQYGDARMSQAAGPRSPGMQRYGEKGPAAQQGGGRPVPLRVEKVSDRSLQARLIYGNLCAVNPEDFPPSRDGTDLYILLRGGQPAGEYVVTAQPVKDFPRGCISLSDPQRLWCNITMRDQFAGELYDPFSSGGKAYLGSLDLEIGFASPNKKTEVPYDEDELSKIFIDTYQNQMLAPGQRILMDVRNIPLLIIVKTVGLVDLAMSSDDSNKQVYREANARGILTNQTRVLFHRDGKGDFNMKPSMSKPNSNAILAPDFKFEDMGIGGLGDEFATIFRRAFASRVFPPGLVAKMGIPHVKGMLLYGPPGTGKTLIARQIGKMLNARPPKVINGPEVLNKYVGQSEENIRKLFADAEKEYKEKGDESSLHIIIFDELDAVCKQRGSGAGGGTGVGDSVVNQLLSKLDGVDQLNNILLIGMTNRKDMIDDALLRPGRLEVHLEISLPDEPGRLEIFKIHSSKMRSNGLLDPDVNFEELAGLTKNYSGAEINGLVKAAASFAFSRHTEVGQLAAVKQDVAEMKVNREDFMNALTEVRPAYGVSEAELEDALRLGIMPYGAHVEATVQEMMRVVGMIRDDPNKFSTSVLFHGPKSSGKTAMAAHIAVQSGFPFVKMVTPADLVGYRDDFAKKDYVHRAFSDAYKSPASILILDDFERLIGWNPIGARFSNTMLEALTTLIVSKPPKGHRLLVFVTTSKASVLKMLEIDTDFAKKVAVPAVSNLKELAAVLHESRVFNSGDINEIVNIVQQRTGSDSIGVGIKTILDCIFEAKAGGSSSDVLETFSDLLLEKIQEMQG
ncbi:ATPase family associated with various cellular activities (AAA) domain-containing protein [Hirsutella rhossiliensis]|uniref:Vesicular-fusion protein SEC18 n=1 Tax=Hirsutella rhossiliensis TaxID=111463 RepID=A0A9P8MTI6_9HYPO|nr:ATPase family associated with various cellular activities (AAA) domain-containing protein [Hirsutella rhossiliensis]KAH0960802.1 ATPase family associated with various cellular activities (AAA) domain-containing protein [Hirsutella rhossiliensis]